MASANISTVQAGDFWTKISPGRACSNAYNTSATDSSSDIKNRVIDGSVNVIGSPCLICDKNSGITEPRDAITFP